MTRQAARPLSIFTILALGQFAFPLAVAYLPLNLYLTRYYGGDLQMDIATVGLVLMIARLADFAVDPIIGALSDRYGQKYGRRRFWTLVSIPITLLGVVLTFMPPQGAGPIYLLLSVSIVYFGWTMSTIAYGAWGAEASPDYTERTRITGIRQIFALVGILIASLAPIFTGGGPGSPDGFAPLMTGLGWMVVITMPLSAALLIWLVPEPKAVATGMVSWTRGITIAVRNGPFMRLLVSIFIGRIGAAANLAVVIWFFEKGLALGEAAGLPLLAYLVAAALGAPLWIWAGHKTSKHDALIIAVVIGAIIFTGLFFMPPGHLWATIVVMIAVGLTGSAAATLGDSIAADVVDLDALRSREARAGLLLAFWGIAQKGADAVGVALGLWILWLFNFNPNGANDETALLGLKLAYIAIPIVFGLTSAAFLWNFPLTPPRQRRIRALLERRAARRS